MSPERLACRTEGCANTILPATAKANDGYCMPCVQRRKNSQREEYIRKNRRSVNLYDGVTDPVEIIRIIHTPRRHDSLLQLVPPPRTIEDLYGGLSDAQAVRLMKLAADALRAGDADLAQAVATSLATLTDFRLDEMLETWVEQDHLWPSVIFRGAGPKIRDRIAAAMNAGTTNVNHALCALAWIGDESVVQMFRDWENNPPAWRRGLHVGPARYAHVAGWEPTIMGRRDLYHNHCLAILPAEGSQQPCGALQLLQEAGERCPWCNAELIFLVVLDLSAPFFRFLGFEGPILPVLTCEFCTCYQTVFAEIGIDGSSHWFAGNQRPKWLSEDVENWKRGPWQHVVVRLTPRRGIYATDWCMAGTTSQIGGLPSWVQDAEYPVCPKCAKTMTFIGELDNGHFPGHEGIYYAFFCAACRMTATSYQQT